MTSRMRLLDAVFSFLLWGYAALLAFWFVRQPMPPLQDYIDWVYQGWVGTEWWMRHTPSVMAHFAPVHYPVPNAASQVLLSALTALIGPFSAAKVLTVALLAASAALCRCAAAPFHAPGVMAFVLFLCFGPNSVFWDGYVNYQLSLLLFLSLLLRRTRLSAAGVALWGILLFFCHAAMFLAFATWVGFETLADQKHWRRALGLLPGLLLLAWYALLKHDPVARQGVPPPLYGGLAHHLAYKVYTLTKVGPFHNLVDFQDISFMRRAHGWYLFGVGLNALFGAGLVAVLLPGTWRLMRTSPRGPLIWTAGVLFALFLVLPAKTFGVVNLGERLLYPALLILLLALRELRGGTVLAALGCAGTGLTVAQLLTMPTARITNVASVSSTEPPASERYLDRYGLYQSRLYQFDVYRVFLQRPNFGCLPIIGFDTSLFADREPFAVAGPSNATLTGPLGSPPCPESGRDAKPQ